MDILQEIAHNHAKVNKLKWEGTFAQYLQLVKQNRTIAQSAHARVYNMIKAAGIEVKAGQNHYHFFENHLYGMTDTIERLVEEYFHPAAKRLDIRKRILLLMGPVGSGKSTIVTLLKRGLENYTKTAAGAIYAIKDCPMFEDPLKLIPEKFRSYFFEQYGIKIEGSLSPLNKLRLKEQYNGNIADVLVERVFISEEDRVGIGTFTPSDPKSQDIADLTGSLDFSTITTYGSESDPRAYRFDGELNIANRGIMEFQEMLKCDEKFLWHLLSLTQEGNFKASRFALISADELIVAHSNETEYRSFIANSRNEALQSRIIVMRVPYNLIVSEEEKIYEKIIYDSDIKQEQLAPQALKIAAIFTILTRLKESKQLNIDLVKKMYLYNGEPVDGFTSADLSRLKAEYPDEGMDGIDPRFIINRISAALIRKHPKPVNGLDLLRSFQDGFNTHPSITKEKQAYYLQLITLARKQYDHIVKKEVQKAFIDSYEDYAQNLLDNYLDSIEAYCNRSQVIDPLTNEQLDPDETLMRSIEQEIGISKNSKKAFREEILINISTITRQGKQFNYKSHERLREAIEKKLFNDLKDLIKLTTRSKSPDPNQLKRVAEVVNRLVNKHGYTEQSAQDLLHYVGSMLSR